MKYNHRFELTEASAHHRVYAADGAHARLDFFDHILRVAILRDDTPLLPTWSVSPGGEEAMPLEGRDKLSVEGFSLASPAITEENGLLRFTLGGADFSVELKNFRITAETERGLLYRDRSGLAYNLQGELGTGTIHYTDRFEGEKVFGLGDKTGPVDKAGRRYLDESDRAVIAQPLDFMGFNCYLSNNYEECGGRNAHGFPGQPRTLMGWPITPDVLYWAVRFLRERWGLPMMITENGYAGLDFIMSDGKVHDPQRIEFLKGYLHGLKQAADEGIPLIGYQYWSIMDNFEWAEGYDKRFGLIYIDYPSQRRVLKDSALWYAQLIAANGEDL